MAQSGYRISSATSTLQGRPYSLTMEIESDSAISFLDVLIIMKEMTLPAKVYGKPTHTGRYLSFKSNHPPRVEGSLIQSSQ
jgi:hypothetical protein